MVAKLRGRENPWGMVTGSEKDQERRKRESEWGRGEGRTMKEEGSGGRREGRRERGAQTSWPLWNSHAGRFLVLLPRR